MIHAAVNQQNQSLFVAQAAGLSVNTAAGVKVQPNVHRQFQTAGRSFVTPAHQK